MPIGVLECEGCGKPPAVFTAFALSDGTRHLCAHCRDAFLAVECRCAEKCAVCRCRLAGKLVVDKHAEPMGS